MDYFMIVVNDFHFQWDDSIVVNIIKYFDMFKKLDNVMQCVSGCYCLNIPFSHLCDVEKTWQWQDNFPLYDISIIHFLRH